MHEKRPNATLNKSHLSCLRERSASQGRVRASASAQNQSDASSFSTPELLTVEVARSLSFHLDVAFDLALAGESHFVFVADVSEKCFRISAELRRKVLDQSRLRNVVLAFFDVDPARTAHAETLTVQVLVESLVEFHACLAGGFSKVGTLWNVDGFFLFDERDLRHGPLPLLRVQMPEKPDIRWLTCQSEKPPGHEAGNGTRAGFEFPDNLSGSDF